MDRSTWKKTERAAAALFGAKRFAANTGGRLDFESELAVGQVKHCRNLSHQQLSALAMELEQAARAKEKLGVIVHRIPRGPLLVTLTARQFEQWFSFRERHPD